jgi:hypothetical protein
VGTTAFVVAGTTGQWHDDVDATHLLRLVEGDRAVWRVTTLHGPPCHVQGWWPANPERIAPDLFALLAVTVLGASTSLPVRHGGCAPAASDLVEVERLAAVARDAEGLAVAVASLPGSTLEPGQLATPGRLGRLVAARLEEVISGGH